MENAQNPEIDVEWDKVHQSNFESAAFNHTSWISKAIDLLVTAKKLESDLLDVWERVEKCLKDPSIPTPANYVQESYFMVMSFAVENLFKAKLVLKNGTQYKERFREIMGSDMPLEKKLPRVFPNSLKTHDLFKLSQQVKLVLNPGEEDLLRRMSHNATWAGRYPAPLNHKDFPGLVRFSNGKIFTVAWFGCDDVKTINAFINSLPERLGLHISHKWPIE